MSERRYDDDEVSEILARATEVTRSPEGGFPGPSLPTEGLTLADLEAIGAEVGIPPERIADAARALDRAAPASPPRTLVGAPRSVTREVPIKGPLDDGQWERLVAEVRETFGATGEVTVHGALRSWTNGNLQVHVEPVGHGWRVRMQTMKGDALAMAGMGGFFALFGTVFVVLSLLGGIATPQVLLGFAFLVAGLGQLGWVRASLPRWADERAEQMERLAERIPHLLEP